MTTGELWRRLHYLLHRSRLERELREEMEAHRAMRGHSPVPFGNVRRLREESAEVWGWGWWDRLRQDLTFGGRMMRKSPAFTLTAVAVLAIGAGVNITAFQLFDAIALAPLPVREPDSLVRFHRRTPNSRSSAFSFPALTFYSTHNHTLAATMAVAYGDVAIDDDTTREVPVHFVSPNYFSELGAAAVTGRLLTPADGAGADPVIVLSEPLWRARFGSDPAIVGRVIRINDRTVAVAGVAGETFPGLTGRTTAAWMPIATHPYIFPGSDLLTNLDGNPMQFFGRLQQGVTRERATADLGAVAAALHDAIPGAAWDGEFVDVLPAGRFATMQGVAPGLSLAAALTAIVLLAACANLGTLLLARGLAREREFAVRLSVGATRVRLARQLMTESVMLAAAGTVAALGVSFITARLLLAASDAPRFLEPRLDVPVLIFSIVIAAAAAALAGLTPAFQAVKPAASRARARGVLVAVQVGAGCTLLVVAALLARGIDRVLHAPLGFDYDAQLVIDPGLDAHGFTPQAARAYWNRLRIEVGALPAVRSVSLATLPPLGNRAMTTRLSNAATAYVHHIEPEYFRTMGIPLLRGRLFDAAERDVAIVSESFARVMWPGEDALGKEYDSAAVIGVAGNASTISPGNASAVELYRPIDDQHLAQAIMIVRVDGDPARRVGALAEAARRIDRRAPPSIASVARNFDAKLQPPRRASAAISALGVTALALAAIGFGGLIAFTVSQRTREIGIRLALGARRVHIISALLSQFTRPLALGVLGGLCGAATVAAVLRRELFGLNLFDPVSYAGAVALLLVAGTLAAAGPIRRALRVDPVSSLRCD